MQWTLRGGQNSYPAGVGDWELGSTWWLRFFGYWIQVLHVLPWRRNKGVFCKLWYWNVAAAFRLIVGVSLGFMRHGLLNDKGVTVIQKRYKIVHFHQIWWNLVLFCEATTTDITDSSAWRNLCHTIPSLHPIRLAMDSISCKYVDGCPEIDVIDINFSSNYCLVFSCISMRVRFNSPQLSDSRVAIGNLVTISADRYVTTA